MKIQFRRLLVPVFGLIGSVLLASPASAGSAVASDGHGGYGYAHGHRSQRELCREATTLCREQSEYPDNVKIVLESEKCGSGIVLRFRVDGRQQIYACVGANDDRAAYRRAAEGARDAGADGKLTVVQRWED